MAAFDALDWSRLDVCAIVAFSGLATIALEDRERHCAWLAREGYRIESIDCRDGLGTTMSSLGRKLRWEEQFGYSLTLNPLNLSAVRDGFAFDVPDEGGLVLELANVDVLWREQPDYVAGLLGIASEHSRQQLALGKRFFTALVVPTNSPMIGATLDPLSIPVPWRD